MTTESAPASVLGPTLAELNEALERETARLDRQCAVTGFFVSALKRVRRQTADAESIGVAERALDHHALWTAGEWVPGPNDSAADWAATECAAIGHAWLKTREALSAEPTQPGTVLGHDGIARPGTAVDTTDCPKATADAVRAIDDQIIAQHRAFEEASARRAATLPPGVKAEPVSLIDNRIPLPTGPSACFADVKTATTGPGAGLPDVFAAAEMGRRVAETSPAGPWCENCGDAFTGPERDCPQPAPGRPYKECGRGGHMFKLEHDPAKGPKSAEPLPPDNLRLLVARRMLTLIDKAVKDGNGVAARAWIDALAVLSTCALPGVW
jgi:hypothetical protein